MTTNIYNKLKAKAKELNTREDNMIMTDREKGDIPENKILTIINFMFLKDAKDIEYSVLNFKEASGQFFFGNAIITDKLKALTALGEKPSILKDGLPVLFTKEMNKKGTRSYMNCEFFPEDPQDDSPIPF